jgi:hypothetical protein
MLVALAGTGRALAQEAEYSGRDFAGLQLDLPAQPGGLALAAQRSWAWTEPAASGATVQRLLLVGDAHVTLGTTRLVAARAVVWIERLSDPGAPPRHQVAVLFDRVGSPTATSGSTTAGDRLLVTAVIDGPVSLKSDAPPVTSAPAGDAFVAEGQARLARYLRAIGEPDARLRQDDLAPIQPAREDQRGPVYAPGLSRPFEPSSPLGPDAPPAPPGSAPRARAGSDAASVFGTDQRLFSGGGLLTIAAGDPALQTGTDENTLIITGGVVLQYAEPARERSLQLSAQRAVVFLEPGPIQNIARTSASSVRGIYLEGDVLATDNRFTLRTPRVFYDLKANKAHMVDAVFWTYDERRALPLYVRAKAIEQTARNKIKASGVTLAASAFFEPQLALAAREVTITREARPDGGAKVMVDATSLRPTIAGVPVLWFPGYKGDLERFPIKDIRFENSSAAGAGVQTRWDLFGATGLDAPEGTDVDILLDAWLRRGFGAGIDSAWKSADARGSLFAYFLPSDDGEDVLAQGTRVNRDNDARGMLLFEHRTDLSPTTRLFLEGSFISDENFVQAYDQTLGETRRPPLTGALLRDTQDNAVFTVQATGTLLDFNPSEYLQQSPGRTTTRLPEATYTRIADDLLADNPGLLQWTSEYRVGRLQLDSFKTTPRQLGFTTPASSQLAFGLQPDESFYARDRAAGVPEQFITRADTRHELAMNVALGPFNVTPFVVGRFSAYSDELKSAAFPTQDDASRWWASAGVRASTTVQRVYADARSDALDVSGLRHIVTPAVTAWTSAAGRPSESLPVFDPGVEGLTEATAYAFDLDQTLQTKRGRTGDGRGHVADLLKLRTGAVLSNEPENVSPTIGRWLDTRPEEGNIGDFAYADAGLLLTDSLTLTGATVYDFDINQAARTSAGVWFDHGRDFSVFSELRYLNALNTTYLDVGGEYRLTDKYELRGLATIDTDEGELRSVTGRIDREFPDLTISVKLGYDQLTDEFTTGLVVTPLGRTRRVDQFRRLGRDQALEPLREPVPASDAAPR